MLKQTITFTDYNDQQRTIEEYFHINEAELIDMQAHSEGGIQADLEAAVKSNDIGQILDFIKMLVHKSYGKKSVDGIHFDKSPELTQSFINSAYYSDFLLSLIEENGDKGIEFIKGVLPKKLMDRALAQAQGQPEAAALATQYAPNAREQFAQAQQVAPQPAPAPVEAPQETDEEREFREWKANRAQAAPTQTVPHDPIVAAQPFRVAEEPPLQGFPSQPNQ
jgi:hypothetical protein